MRLISLFSGIGGFEIAAEIAGFETVAMVEKDPDCRAVLACHFPGAALFGDIDEFINDLNERGNHYGSITVISAGVPCQPVSKIGEQKGSGDDRWLWPASIEAIQKIRPEFAIFENPPGISTVADGLEFETICADLESAGYEIGAYDIPAYAVGAGQIRSRIFIIAHCMRPGLEGHPGNDELSSGQWTDPGGSTGEASIPEIPGSTDPGTRGKLANDPDLVGLANLVYGIPAGLDLPDWTMFGEWGEPEIFAFPEKYWQKRLTMLGNAVIPEQVLLFFLMIRRWKEGVL